MKRESAWRATTVSGVLVGVLHFAVSCGLGLALALSAMDVGPADRPIRPLEYVFGAIQLPFGLLGFLLFRFVASAPFAIVALATMIANACTWGFGAAWITDRVLRQNSNEDGTRCSAQ